MNKNIITVITSIIMIALCMIALINSTQNNSVGITDDMENISTESHKLDEYVKDKIAEDNKKYKNPQFGDIITARISDEQIVPMHTPVVIQNDMYRDLQYTVNAAYATRVLPEEYEVRESTRRIYGEDIIDEYGTILKDWYYIVVDISVKNTGKKVSALIPKTTEVIFIDDNLIATDDTKIHKDSVSCRETSEIKRFNELKYIPDFQPNEISDYQQVFIVTEQDVKDNDVYIRATEGTRGERALADSAQRYIKLELEVK